MSTTEAIVLRRVVLNRATLTGGALALHNYQLGLARADSEIVMRDDIGSFHYFKSDSANELKYSQLGHVHDDRYYTETEIDTKLSSIIHSNLSGLQGGQAGKYYHLTQLEWETKILGLGITGRIPLYSADRQITSSVLSGDANGIYPITNNTKTLGSTSLRFSEVWGTTLYENGTTLASRYEGLWERATVTAASNLNNYNVPGTYAVSNAASATNMPSGAYGFGVLQVLPFSTVSVAQMYMPHRNGTLYTSGIWLRVCYTGTWQDWQHIYGDAYNATKYAQKEDPVFTGLMTALNAYFSGTVTHEGAAVFGGSSDLRSEVLLTGLQVGTDNANASIADTASGFVNTATYTENRTVTLPVPKKGKILTLSNLGSSTTYNMLIKPYSGTSIHYGITPNIVGGDASGIKSLILEGVSSTQWMVISMWSL